MHLPLLTNCIDMIVATEPKVTRKVYTFNSTFKTASEFKSTAFGKEFQAITTRSVKKIVTISRKARVFSV